MRFASIITLSLLIHLGLLSRLVAEDICCPDSSLEHVHEHGKNNGAHPEGDCNGGRDLSDHQQCPSDCGEPHHHHGKCIHCVPMSLLADCQCSLAPPCAVSLACERQNLRAPDGPVMELDKPPLI